MADSLLQFAQCDTPPAMAPSNGTGSRRMGLSPVLYALSAQRFLRSFFN
jgi:hypothetical protein